MKRALAKFVLLLPAILIAFNVSLFSYRSTPALAAEDTTSPVTTPTGSDVSTSNPGTETPTPTPTAAPTPAATPIPTPTPQTGPQTPPGPASQTYTYNSQTGLWENDYYTWDPATNLTAPKYSQDYSYNPGTGMWDTKNWVYNPASGAYEANITSVSADPYAAASPTLQPAGPAISPNTSDSIFNLFFNAAISNNIQTLAQTGDASVANNTLGGSASSGNASALLNLINLINSAWSFLTGKPIIFTANITGNVTGDMYIDPSNLTSPSTANPDLNLQVNAVSSGLINNNATVQATSSNASVQQNTTAGNATSGNALAMANIMNLLNSTLSAGQSFVGILNITGSLNGDILLSGDGVNTLLASNLVAADPVTSSSANVNNNSSGVIVNQIGLGANSGLASVTDNTTAGNATSGQTDTGLTLLNLTGQQVIGSDALVVFVNNLGHWSGLILNAPTGATAGLLGNNVSDTTTLANIGTANISQNSSNTIVNNVGLNAQSGNALVSQNTAAGNATSGNATASANILNIANSSMSLSGWFGVLFINVLGNWNGSFGVNTAAGNPIVTPPATNPVAQTPSPVFSFVPTSQPASDDNSAGSDIVLTSSDASNNGAIKNILADTGSTDVAGINTTSQGLMNFVRIVLYLAGGLVLLSIVEYVFSRRTAI